MVVVCGFGMRNDMKHEVGWTWKNKRWSLGLQATISSAEKSKEEEILCAGKSRSNDALLISKILKTRPCGLRKIF